MQHDPEMPRGFIGDWSQEEMWITGERLQISRAGMNLGNATPELVTRARDKGYYTVAWPCNDEQSVRKVMECGFDGVCTDAPSLFAPMFGRAVNKIG